MNTQRRSFLKGAAATLAFPTIIPASALGLGNRPAPSERITLGCIGTGNNGINWLRNFLQDDRVQVVAMCDVNVASAGYWAGREGGREVARGIANGHYGNEGIGEADSYNDYRELLAREDIDAVQIATPDHWHAIQVISAARAGKHIYGQKPLSLTIREGRAMSDAVAEAGITFQTGSQQRSDQHFRRGIELVRNGFIGKVHTVRVGLPGGHPDYSKRGSERDEVPVPEGFDYDTWLGLSPEAPYSPARLHVNWRWILDYSGGQLTDWGAHHIDIAQWAMGKAETGPVSLQQIQGDLPPATDFYNTATAYDFECTYADGLKLVIGTSQRGGVTFEGEDEKSIHTNRGHLSGSPEDVVAGEITAEMERVYVSDNHVGNFVDCVFSGEAPVAPIEHAHRSISIAHLANIALQTGREELAWNPDTEEITDDAAASAMLTRDYRGDWAKDVDLG